MGVVTALTGVAGMCVHLERAATVFSEMWLNQEALFCVCITQCCIQSLHYEKAREHQVSRATFILIKKNRSS